MKLRILHNKNFLSVKTVLNLANSLATFLSLLLDLNLGVEPWGDKNLVQVVNL